MASDALTAELMAVPGVASAEVDDPSAAVPAGVRVKLSAEADPRRVGAEVQRILAAHGMRSRFAEPSPPAPPSAPAPGDSLVILPPPPEGAPPSVEVAPLGAPPTLSVAQIPKAVDADEPAPSGGGAMGEVPDTEPEGSAGGADVEVVSVAVEERAEGVAATVTLADGRTSSRAVVEHGRRGIDGAIAQALLAAAASAASVVAIEWIEDGADAAVTVAVRAGDGSLAAGTAVVTVGRALAVGYATRRALVSPEG